MRPFPFPFPLRSAIPSRARGLSMVELVVVLAITAALATAALPAFSGFIKSQKVKTMGTDLHLSLMRARSEAIRRNRNVTILPSSGGWEGGWTIPDPDYPTLNIESHSAFSGLTVTGPVSVIYQNSGRLSATTAPTFSISASGTNYVRCVSADLSGRPNTKATAC